MKIILLDIDGVLSPLEFTNRKTTLVDLDGWSTVAIPNDNIEFIKTLSQQAEIVWSSSWENISNNICDKVGLAHFRFLRFYNTQQSYWNKLPAIIEFIDDNLDIEILIIDDEVETHARNVLNKYNNVEVIDIEFSSGLSNENKKEIEKWLKS